MRRLLVALLLLAVCAAVAWTLFRWNGATRTTADPWRAIPERSAAILSIPDAWTTWDRFTHTSQFWTSLEHLPAASALGRLMDRAAARAENDAALRSALQQLTVLVAMMRTGGDHVDVLVACSSNAGEAVPVSAFAQLLKVDEASLATLGRGEVVQCRPDTALPALSLAMQQGIWMLASSPTMMDEALLQLKSGRTITQETLFRDAMNTLGGGADAHVLVHVERAKNALHAWWRAAVLEAQDLPPGWAALDLRARPDAFLLSGLILPDTAHGGLSALAHQGTGRNDLGRWLPVDVAAWDVRQVNDGERYLRDWGVASDSLISTLAPGLFNWVHGSVGLAHTGDSSGVRRPLALFQTDDPEGAASEVRRSCPDGRTCDTLAHRGVQLTQLPVEDAFERLLGPSYAAFHRPWWSVLGDVLVFAPDPETLRGAIDAWHDGRTLAEDARTSAWTERIASTAGRTIRWDIARYWPRIADGLKPDIAAAAGAESDTWQRIGGLALQLSPAQHGRTHVSIGLQHAPVTRSHTGIHWSTPLPPGATRRPDIVRNHTNNTREVLVQDGEHRIHLVGSSGKVLWNYALDGPVIGEMHQVDRFKNGKLQLLFNTAAHVYLIDRNGRDVGGFPIVLPAKTAAPIAVFDYEKTREYRVLVGLADGRVVNYGMDGLPTSGWEPPSLDDASSNAVHHLRIKNKDHLLTVDGKGRIRILDRRGGEREHATLDLGANARVLVVSPGLELHGTRVVWADTSGTIREATLNGSPRDLSPPGRNFLGGLADDGTYRIVRIAGDSLIVAHGGREIMARSFGAALAPEVGLHELGRARFFGVVIAERGLVTLLDESGREPEGLPLPGSTLFSIADLDLDGRSELVTVTADGHVVAYSALSGDAVR